MTKQGSFKKVVRRHAAETGQRYTGALTELEGLEARMTHEPVAERLVAHVRARYAIDINARSALHLLELRTQPAGHPGYRRVCQEMHRLIAEQAGHRLVAEMMTFVDHGTYDLERLDAERRAEARRAAADRQA